MKVEFQAVILAAGQGSRLSDLTSQTSKCLLPVGNKPMVLYAVYMLEKAGFQDAILVTTDSQKDDVCKCLIYKCNIKLDIMTIPDDKDWGTADTLRHIADKLQNDFLVVSSDLILADIPLHRIADVHRVNDATCTALFSPYPAFLRDVQVPGPKSKRKLERDLVGIDESNSRLLYLTSEADLDEHLSIRRSVLQRYPKINIHTELHDAHLYMFKHQVLDILKQHPSISAIKGELLPYLVKRQFTKQGTARTVECSDLEYYSSSHGVPVGCQDSSSCHVYVSDGGLAVRLNTLTHYMEVNRQISRYMSSLSNNTNTVHLIHPQAKLAPKSQVGGDSVVGSDTVVGERSSVKHSILGEHVKVGERCKISNSVIMDHVNISDNCDISGCLIAANVTIESDAKLKDCLVSYNEHIKQHAKFSSETIVAEKRMMEI